MNDDVIRAVIDAWEAADPPVCDSCDADAELVEVAPNVVMLHVYHEVGCAWLAFVEGRLGA